MPIRLNEKVLHCVDIASDEVFFLREGVALDDRKPHYHFGGLGQCVDRLALVDSLTRNLDEAVGETAVDQMLELVGETGAGLLLVAHSNRLAARMSRSLRLGAGRVAVS